MKRQVLSLLAASALLAAGCAAPSSPPHNAGGSPTPPSVSSSTVAASGQPVAAVSGGPDANVPAEGGWSWFEPTDGSFRVQTPVTLAVVADKDNPQVARFVGQGGDGNRAWTVVRVPVPEETLKSKKPEELAKAFLQDNAKVKGIEVFAGQISGHSALFGMGVRPDGNHVMIGTMVVETNAWLLSVVTPKDAPKNLERQSLNRFFNSFVILKSAGAIP